MSEASKPHLERSLDMLADVSRALGLAQALANPVAKEVRPGSMEKVASEIVFLLNRTREEILSGV